jgi:hypothetical protein
MFPLDCYRRSYDRYETDASATVHLNAPLNDTLILKDLSARGAGAIGSRSLKANECVDIVIMSSLLKEPLHTKAKIAWCKPFQSNVFHTGFDFGLDNTIDLTAAAALLRK